MSDKSAVSEKSNKRIREITPETFAAFLRSYGELTKTKKLRVDTPKPKADGGTTGDTIQIPNEIVPSTPTPPPMVRVTRQNAATTTAHVSNSKRATKAPRSISRASKVHAKREMAKFPNPSQSNVLLHLCQDFGLQLLDTNNNNNNTNCETDTMGGSCRWEGQEFPSVAALRTHLCRTGLVAPSSEWFYENMQPADPLYYFAGGTGLYVPETKKARMIADWVRLDMVPPAHRKATSLEWLSKTEVQAILRKLGVRAAMGYFNMDGEELQWKQVEQKLATFGLSEQLWEHPGATVTEKLSVLLFCFDYRVM